jgi:hypothetical protein
MRPKGNFKLSHRLFINFMFVAKIATPAFSQFYLFFLATFGSFLHCQSRMLVAQCTSSLDLPILSSAVHYVVLIFNFLIFFLHICYLFFSLVLISTSSFKVQVLHGSTKLELCTLSYLLLPPSQIT